MNVVVDAHVGHWAINLVYFAPVAIVVLVLTVQARRDARRRAASGELPDAD